MNFERVQAVADAILYEGYALYPYRASARKNQLRWQFGALLPPAYCALNPSETSSAQTECVVEAWPESRLHVRARFLQLEARRIEAATVEGEFMPAQQLAVDDALYVSWDEGIEQRVDATATLAALATSPLALPVELPGDSAQTLLRSRGGRVVGRLTRERRPLTGFLTVRAAWVADSPWAAKVTVRLENVTPWRPEGKADRAEASLFAFLGVHFLLGVEGGGFVSAIDPPPWASAAVGTCINQHLWPVLVGQPGTRDMMLAAPIILYDYPQVAPESPQHLYDGTEIDELLIWRTLLLTDEEKREARATDPRIAALLDLLESLPPADLQRLHGAIRARWPAEATARGRITVGSRVRLRPKLGRTDAQDLFVAGRIAVVEEIRTDITGTVYLGVTVEDDPGADLLRAVGRYRYFTPDEVELLEEDA